MHFTKKQENAFNKRLHVYVAWAKINLLNTHTNLTCPAWLFPLRWWIEDVIDSNGRAWVVGGDFTMTALF